MTPRRPAVATLVASLVLLAALPAVATATPWAKISGDRVSSIDQGTLLQSGARVLASWPAGDRTDLATAVELRGFAPTLARPGNGAGPIAVVALGYTALSFRTALLATSVGPRVVYSASRPDGQRRLFLSGPLTEGAAPSQPPSELVATNGGNLDAVLLADPPPDGTPLVADDRAGGRAADSPRGPVEPRRPRLADPGAARR